MKNIAKPYTEPELARFCMQISILLKSAVPLYEGLTVMSEDETDSGKKELLAALSSQVRLGIPFHQAVKETGCFPNYTVNMILWGERTGLLDVTTKGLSQHYDKESQLSEDIRRAIAYPSMMIIMLLMILFVLFAKVMPVFSGVYEQLGASIPPAVLAAVQVGRIVSGAALLFFGVTALMVLVLWVMGKGRHQVSWAVSALLAVKSRSRIALYSATRRFCSVMSMGLQCGISMPEACKMAETLVEHPVIRQKVMHCGEFLAKGGGFYESVKQADLFSGFELQLIRVGSRAGRLESVMSELAKDLEQKVSDSIDHRIAVLEPTIVSILAIAVGLVLMAVMLPLVGVLSTIG